MWSSTKVFLFYLSRAESTKYLKEMWTSLKWSSQTSLQELGSIQRYLSVDISKSESKKKKKKEIMFLYQKHASLVEPESF